MRPFLGSSVLVGLMSGMTQNGVNLISAPLLAREAGIRVSCQEQEPEAAARAVTVTVEREGRSYSATGEHGSPLRWWQKLTFTLHCIDTYNEPFQLHGLMFD